MDALANQPRYSVKATVYSYFPVTCAISRIWPDKAFVSAVAERFLLEEAQWLSP